MFRTKSKLRLCFITTRGLGFSVLDSGFSVSGLKFLGFGGVRIVCFQGIGSWSIIQGLGSYQKTS